MKMNVHAETGQSKISAGVLESIDAILRAMRSYLNMDVAFLTEFLGDERVFHNVDVVSAHFDLRSGMRLPMGAGYCEHIAKGILPQLIRDTASVPVAQTIPETNTVPIGSHLSVPVILRNGRVFGTFCCFSHRPRIDLGLRDLSLLQTFAELIATLVSADVDADRKEIEKAEHIRAAIAQGDPQIVFQPIVSLADMRIVGAEALARFATLPLRAPDVWFEEAESLGLGVELELAAASAALLQATRLPEPVAVNLNFSAQALLSSDIHTMLWNFDPKRVVIELTEHAIVQNYAPVARRLAFLRQKGMRVAIDDVGAGYSSMRHALDLDPDILKFDTSLTRGINADPRRQAMIAALCDFARRTSIDVVAEGVETIGELQTLMGLGVEKAQGYLFSHPKPMSELLADWFDKGKQKRRSAAHLRVV